MDELLAAEPDNAEYLDVKESLAEVIALTEDLLASSTAAAAGATAQDAGVAGDGGADAAAIAAATAAALMTTQTVTGAACQALYDGQGGAGRRGSGTHTHGPCAQLFIRMHYFQYIYVSESFFVFFSHELEWGVRSRWHERKPLTHIRMYAFLISKEIARL